MADRREGEAVLPVFEGIVKANEQLWLIEGKGKQYYQCLREEGIDGQLIFGSMLDFRHLWMT